MPEEQSFAAFTENLEMEQMRQLGDRLVTKSLLYHWLMASKLWAWGLATASSY